MFFSTIKKCNDDRVIKTGLDAITEFRRAGVGVIAFACCFVKGTLVISFGYDIPYPENMKTAMVMWVIERLPEEEKYKKVEYYPADKFDAECGKHCKHLWLVVQE
mgnify:FL=1